MSRLCRTMIVGVFLTLPALAQPVPLHRAHAHNDYAHDRPLLDALERGFTSIEVDVHEQAGALRVGHDAGDLTPDRTIQTLYLDPIADRAAAQHGRLFQGDVPLQLLVDFKTEAAPTYAALERILEGYRPLLTRYENGVVYPGAVTVVVSGNRPRAQMEAEHVRYAFYDGRLEDLDARPHAPASLMPLVSASWWDVAPMGSASPGRQIRRRIRALVDTAHAQGKKIRFWATPEDEDLWRLLYEAGVDYLNTDRLEAMKMFLERQAE